MQCWQCGSTVRQGAKLCIYCGAKLEDDTPAESARGGRGRPDEREGRADRADRSARPDRPGRGGRDEFDDDAPPQERSPRERGERPSARSAPRDERSGERRPSRPILEPGGEWGRLPAPRRPTPQEPQEPRGTREPRGDGDARGERNRMEERYRGPDAGDGERRGREPRAERGGREGGAGWDERADAGWGGRGEQGGRYAYEQRGAREPRDARDARDARRRYEERGAAPDLDLSWNAPALDPQPAPDEGAYRRRPEWNEPPAMGARGGRWSPAVDGAAPQPEFEEFAGPARYRGDDGRAVGAPTNAPAKAKRSGCGRTALVIGLVALLLFVAVGGVAAFYTLKHRGGASVNTPTFATYTPGPTPTPPTGFSQFVSATLGYAMDYPSSWSQPASDTGAKGQTPYDYTDSYAQPTLGDSVIVEQAQALGPLTDAEALNAEVTSSQHAGNTFTAVASPVATMMIGGERWTRKDYTVTLKAGATIRMALLACHHAGRGYVIVLAGKPDTFGHEDQTTFQTMLQTYRFLS